MTLKPRHLILGTSGHVDHGKTSLVRALTGVDTDTHPEEKRRGITIHLGFTHLTLDDGTTVGFVDVPGHKDFIATMVSGASGVDMALLVIAADEGLMPQTREHLQILQSLGVHAGVIALTKSDLLRNAADRESRLAEIRDFLRGTSLESAPIVFVSSTTSEGLQDLKSEISRLAPEIERMRSKLPAPSLPRDPFRLFIDRVFSIPGTGTVVTGSVLSGSVSVDTELFVLGPHTQKRVRVRGLQRFGEAVSQIQAGDRAALNLTGLDKSEFVRGMALSSEPLKPTRLWDAVLTMGDTVPTLKTWTQATCLQATQSGTVRIHLLDADPMDTSRNRLVQIHAESPFLLRGDDLFLLRDDSRDLTIAGGRVLDPSPLHHRRRPKSLVERLRRVAQGDLDQIVIHEVLKSQRPVSLKALALRLGQPFEAVQLAAQTPPPGDSASQIQVWDLETQALALRPALAHALQTKALDAIRASHAKAPHLPTGLTLAEGKGLFGDDLTLQAVMASLEAKGEVRAVSGTWTLATHKASGPQALSPAMVFIRGFLKDQGLRAPSMADLFAAAKLRGFSDTQIKPALSQMQKDGLLYVIEGSPVDATLVNSARTRLLTKLRELEAAGQTQGITVAEFRDLIDGNRKICLLLIGQYDREGYTRRQGDFRTLTQRGREATSP